MVEEERGVRKMSNGGGKPVGACSISCLVLFAVFSALFVSGPAFYTRFNEGFQKRLSLYSNSFSSSSSTTSSAPSACPSCVCDCPGSVSLQKIAPGEHSLSRPFYLSVSMSLSVCQISPCLFASSVCTRDGMNNWGKFN